MPSPFGRRKIVDTKLGDVVATLSTPCVNIFSTASEVSAERGVWC